MLINSDLTKELLSLEKLLVQNFLSKRANLQYLQGKIAKDELNPFVELIEAMAEAYLSKRSVVLNEQQLKAYALYYLPINFAKVQFLLRQKVELDRPLKPRILDFGCGPGSAALAVAATFIQPLDISLSDASPFCLKMAKDLVSEKRTDCSIKTLNNLCQVPKSSFDLIIAANVLSEMDEYERQAKLETLIALLDQNGYLLLLFPALKDTTITLMKLRDQILPSHPELSITFPCSTHSKCPMLKNNHEDWCHGELATEFWQRPPLLTQFDELLGFNKHRIKYSALILQRAERRDSQSYRLIRPSRKNHPALLCGQSKLVTIESKASKDFMLRRVLKNGDSYQMLDL